MAESSPNRQKTLWEKEKLLIMSNFSFSHIVFKRLVLQTRKNQGLFGKGSRCCLQFVSILIGLKFCLLVMAGLDGLKWQQTVCELTLCYMYETITD